MICHLTEMDKGDTLFSSCFGALLDPYLINPLLIVVGLPDVLLFGRETPVIA